MGLNLAERSFLQCMMGTGALSAKKAAALFNSCVENANLSESQRIRDDGRGLDVTLGRVNTYLGAYDLQFSAAFYGNETCWGLTNTGRDDAVTQATQFSPSELGLFFTLKDLIMASGGSVSLTDAHNLGPGVKLRVADAARTIARLVSLQWLRVVRRGGATVEFGPRSLLELPDVRAWARKKDDEDVVKEEVESGSVEEKEEETKASSRRPPSSQRHSSSLRAATSQRQTRSRRISVGSLYEGDDDDVQIVGSSQAPSRRITRSRASQVSMQDDDEVTVVRSKSGRRKRRVR